MSEYKTDQTPPDMLSIETVIKLVCLSVCKFNMPEMELFAI